MDKNHARAVIIGAYLGAAVTTIARVMQRNSAEMEGTETATQAGTKAVKIDPDVLANRKLSGAYFEEFFTGTNEAQTKDVTEADLLEANVIRTTGDLAVAEADAQNAEKDVTNAADRLMAAIAAEEEAQANITKVLAAKEKAEAALLAHEEKRNGLIKAAKSALSGESDSAATIPPQRDGNGEDNT